MGDKKPTEGSISVLKFNGCVIHEKVINGFWEFHREDGPAVEYDSGKLEWYNNGCLHRDNNLPAIEYPLNSGQEWFVFGVRHREDGPAVIHNSPKTINEYWHKGFRLDRNEWLKISSKLGRILYG